MQGECCEWDGDEGAAKEVVVKDNKVGVGKA
jgi:hypothetical protein